MRLRNKPWAKDLINENLDLIAIQPENMPGKWQARFAKEQPIFIEVGSGKGRNLAITTACQICGVSKRKNRFD